MLIRRICAWCGKTEGFKEVACINNDGKAPVTHTICPDCKKEVENQIVSFSLKVPNQHKSE